ncbi:MAG: DMT family transporter [Hyphomicrobiaceae bacterium]
MSDAAHAAGGEQGDSRLYAYGLSLVLFSAVAFSLGGLFMRHIETQVWNVLFWRGTFSALLITLILLLREGRGVIAAYRAIGRPGLVMACCSALAMTCFLTSISLTTVANNSIIMATSPFVTAGIALLYAGERPGLATMLAAALAMAGVLITLAGSGGVGDIRGDILAVGMTVFASIGPVVVRKHRNIPMLPASSISALLVALMSLGLSRLLGQPSAPWSVGWPDLGVLFLFSLCQQTLGHLAYTAGARYIPAAHTALIFTLDAPLAPLWVWLAIGEDPGTAAFIGGTIVVGAVLGHVLVTTGLLKRWRR